jgi:signal transduction histidine kinase
MQFGSRATLCAVRGEIVPAGNRTAEASPPRAGLGPDPGFDPPADRVRIMSNLCHELRTPLQVLGGYLDILTEDYGTQFAAEPLRILERLRLNASELTQTVENLLEYAAAITGTLAAVAEPVEVADLVEGLEPLFAAAAQRKKISLRWLIEPNLNCIRSDRRLLRSIMCNLVYNAIKFTDQGEVTVRLRQLGVRNRCMVELEVEDTGIGIDEQRLDEAFRPFVQLSESNTRHHRGLGLGLALIKRDVALLGGSLEVRSKPSSGACFKVRLPQGARV